MEKPDSEVLICRAQEILGALRSKSTAINSEGELETLSTILEELEFQRRKRPECSTKLFESVLKFVQLIKTVIDILDSPSLRLFEYGEYRFYITGCT